VTRPAVSVVMPFAGTTDGARAALSALLALERREGDELILADNAGTVPAAPGVTVVSARDECSPAHARNTGAEHATAEWILFLDADCRPHQGLLDAYFATAVEPRVGALVGGVVPVADQAGLAARYGAARNFLSQDAHLAHPFRPRAAAANLMVRAAAFAELGGFYEGLRAAEDTDFSWRLQEAGWLLEARPDARVEHRYRATVAELRRQWRGYAAGRAWLARRYPGFTPEPALVRAARRAWRRAAGGAPGPGGPPGASSPAYLALDVLLALDELAGFVLSNRPGRDPRRSPEPAGVILVTDRFPARGDPLVERARAFPGARVEAARRPEIIDLPALRAVPVDYREDDGIAARAWALARLAARRPGPSLVEKRDPQLRFSTSLDEPGLSALAPAALRLAREPGARVRALDPGGGDDTTARRLAALAGVALAGPEGP
jgi:GT2 family glycosyltransferase